MRGRKRTPTGILKLRDSRHAKNRGNEPRGNPIEDVPDCPDWFDDVARDKWQELISLLTGMGILTDADLDHVRAYCSAFSRWIKSEHELKSSGEIVQFQNGVMGISHWMKIATLALERMDRSGMELGLSPTSRAKLQVTPKEPRKSRFFQKAVG